MLNVNELSYKQFLFFKYIGNRAIERSLDNHAFLSWEWLANWWKHYGSDRKFLCIVAENDGNIYAAAPLMVSP